MHTAMAETPATRSAALALADERTLMRQGHRFLDEKRMLLAAAMLRALDERRSLEAQLLDAMRAAQAALHAALQRHGLEGLQAYAPATQAPHVPPATRGSMLGVALWNVGGGAADADATTSPDDDDAIDASPEARACRAAHAALVAPLARLAAANGNLERLAAEYRRTERRARALENVLLPEVEAALKSVGDQLELAEQEEALRTRLAARG
jgi:V/A-type H+-transporting ATPase subunit D